MYERYFGLVDEPFRLTPDPRYLFLSRKHAEALAHLRLGLSESSGFVCITGDVGTGKTTLLRSFLSGLGADTATAYIFDPTLTALELLRQINGELGLPTYSTSKKALVDTLNAHLLAQREAGRRSIVVIDEAQALAIDVLEQLRLLSNLETTTEKLLKIVLVGQPQLRALLVHPELAQLNQRITLRWHLGPLSRKETATYVRHRLGVASGGHGTHLFTRPALRLVHRYSGGVPRLINMISHRAMLAAFAADRRIVGSRSVRKAYREIGAVPLPARPGSRRRAWAAVVAAAFLGAIALGAGQLGWRPDAWVESPAATPPAPADPSPARTRTAAPEAVAPAPTPAPAVPDAPPPPAAEEPAAPPTAAAPAEAPAAAPAPTPAPAPAGEVEHRLAQLDARASARDAVQALLGAWRVRPLAADEPVDVGELARVAQPRGLDYLAIVGNTSMLRLFDLPAILELRLPETDGVRYVTLTGMEAGRWVLGVGGASMAVEPAAVERYWFGKAHLLWRDFEGLGLTFGREMHGTPVARLQGLLQRAGVYSGPESGQFDTATTTALLDFQRSRFLVPDARVGKLTRIVLYAAAGGYPRPTLAASADGAS